MSSFSNMCVCDLRGIGPEAIKGIDEIRNIAILIIPKDADEELTGLIAAIPKTNIAAIVPASKDTLITTMNGPTILTNSDLSSSQEKLIIVNGVAVISKLTMETNASLVINGALVLHESLKSFSSLNILICNGLKTYLDFDDCKLFSREVTIDAEFISYLQPNTMVIADRSITLEENITVQMLKEKNVRLVAGRSIHCPKALESYIGVFAIVGRQIEANE